MGYQYETAASTSTTPSGHWNLIKRAVFYLLIIPSLVYLNLRIVDYITKNVEYFNSPRFFLESLTLSPFNFASETSPPAANVTASFSVSNMQLNYKHTSKFDGVRATVYYKGVYLVGKSLAPFNLEGHGKHVVVNLTTSSDMNLENWIVHAMQADYYNEKKFKLDFNIDAMYWAKSESSNKTELIENRCKDVEVVARDDGSLGTDSRSVYFCQPLRRRQEDIK